MAFPHYVCGDSGAAEAAQAWHPPLHRVGVGEVEHLNAAIGHYRRVQRAIAGLRARRKQKPPVVVEPKNRSDRKARAMAWPPYARPPRPVPRWRDVWGFGDLRLYSSVSESPRADQK